MNPHTWLDHVSRGPLRTTTIVWATATLVVFWASAAAMEPLKPAAAPGYDDTPFLPSSPWRVHDRRRPQAPLVEPGQQPSAAPSDAIVLFDGKDLSQWQGGNPRGVEAGTINILKTGELLSKRQFGDCQVHVEWMTPAKDDGGPMNWGNSGVFMMDQFEIQIIESRDSHIYADGNAGAIYGQTPPLVTPRESPASGNASTSFLPRPVSRATSLLNRPVPPSYRTECSCNTIKRFLGRRPTRLFRPTTRRTRKDRSVCNCIARPYSSATFGSAP